MKIQSKILTALMLAVPLLVVAQTAQAADAATPGIDRRQANQEKRIQQGVDSGSLNKREASRLERGEKRIERMEEKAKADGRVTPQERARLQRAENVQSKRIYREKHDAQSRK